MPERAGAETAGLLRLAISQGWSGVNLFFVLSGFLIGGILIDNRESANYFRVFYARRAARILPLYLVVVIAILAATPVARMLFPRLVGALLPASVPAWPYLTFAQNFVFALQPDTMQQPMLGVTWSLAIEEQFYLLLPAMIRFTPVRTLPWLCISATLLSLPARLACGYWQPDNFSLAYSLTPCRADALMLGVLSAWAIRQEGTKRFLEEHILVLRLLAGTATAGIAYMTLREQSAFAPQMLTFGQLLFAVLFTSLLLLATLRPGSPEARLLRLRPLKHLGVLAYGIYLFHEATRMTLNTLVFGELQPPASPASAALLVVAATSTYVLASTSWKLLEKPALAWGQRFRY